jgi:hypothetical protein
MRDLVIWCIALDIARNDGGSVLLSEDHVLTGPRGDREAKEAQLERVSTLDDALDALGVDSPAEAAIRKGLVSVWGELQARELEAPDIGQLDIDPTSFVNDEGSVTMRGTIQSRVSHEGRKFASAVTLTLEQNRLRGVRLEDIRVDGDRWHDGILELRVDLPTESRLPDYAALGHYLRLLTGGEDEMDET